MQGDCQVLAFGQDAQGGFDIEPTLSGLAVVDRGVDHNRRRLRPVRAMVLGRPIGDDGQQPGPR